MIVKIIIEGFDADGEWRRHEHEIEDATIDIMEPDGRWSLAMNRDHELEVSWQGGRAADRALMRPVSQNHVAMTVDRSRRSKRRQVAGPVDGAGQPVLGRMIRDD